MSKYAIEIVGLRKHFGSKMVLDGIDLTVPKGKIFALLGPNGAGKTTLINILSTLLVPDNGYARVAGYDVVKEINEVKLSISLTGQFAAIDEMLTAEENLIMMGRLSGLSRTEACSRAVELLKYFDLLDAAKVKVKTYSGGMRRRLDLAVSLVTQREVIFLDEPTTGLDTHSRRALWDIISNLAKEGVTVFLTTQYLEEADQLADTIAVISDGKIVAQGSPEEMKSRISSEVVELRNQHDEIIQEVPTTGNITEINQIIDELNRMAPEGSRINIRKPSLEDVFMALTTQEKERAL